MTEQEENELIAEKLLGWEFALETRDGARMWRGPGRFPTEPHFKSPEQATLILEVLRMRGTVLIELDVHFADVRFQDIRCVEFELPAAVRAVALQVIGQLPASSSTPTPP